MKFGALFSWTSQSSLYITSVSQICILHSFRTQWLSQEFSTLRLSRFICLNYLLLHINHWQIAYQKYYLFSWQGDAPMHRVWLHQRWNSHLALIIVFNWLQGETTQRCLASHVFAVATPSLLPHNVHNLHLLLSKLKTYFLALYFMTDQLLRCSTITIYCMVPLSYGWRVP